MWSSCSTTCGPGLASRSILVSAENGGQNCTGAKSKYCNLAICPGKKILNTSKIKKFSFLHPSNLISESWLLVQPNNTCELFIFQLTVNGRNGQVVVDHVVEDRRLDLIWFLQKMEGRTVQVHEAGGAT